ncbi:MAG: DUF169 domain-containing protein [Gammaproteobacteria bacterium]|nr:DUF169 domain-containing protein [Gammaproteobacteria bacterium]
MTDYKEQAQKIHESLSLTMAPIGVSFCDEIPGNAPIFEGTVAAGCEFWEKASSSLFVTSANDHQLCSIGVYTHNLANAPATQEHELITTLNVMTGLDYVREEEVQSIPTVKNQWSYVVYGPLSDFPIQPDVVLLFAHAWQGLIISEATERIDNNTPLAMGRPACAVIPQVINQGNAAMSLGCCGARAYLDSLTDSTALWVLPGSKLAQYAEQIKILANANQVLTRFHEQRRRDVDTGEQPSVEESLERM